MKTKKNLEAAFAGESMANRKYLYFARHARRLGDEETAKLFESVAEEETSHAFAHLDQMYPKETLTVESMLRLAMEGELYETNQMYPEFEKIALAEKQQAAAREFQDQAAESSVHAGIFEKALEKAARTFKGFAKVEARHAAKYAEALERKKK